MGTVRTKGHEHLPPPLYPPESADITLVLHYGGQFISKPTADYIGGNKVVYDYINMVDGVNIANLSRLCEGLGVLGEKSYYGILENGFKLLWNDYELIKWARGCESIRQVHVWVDGNVQKGSDQSQVHKDNEMFEVHECNDEDLQPEGRDEGGMPGVSDEDEVSPLSSLLDSDYDLEPESTDDDEEWNTDVDDHVIEGGSGGVEDVVCDGDCYDETRVSDDEVHEVRHNEVMFNPTFELGMVFETRNEFKKAVQTHAIRTKRSLRFSKIDKTRVYARCRDYGCDWGINLMKRVNESTFRIRSYRSVHKCAPTSNVINLKSTWLGERYVSTFLNDPEIDVERWRKDIIRELNVNVSKQQAIYAKRRALEIIEGFPDKQHSRLWDYAQKLKRRKCTNQYSCFKEVSSSCTEVVAGEEKPEEPVHATGRQKLKASMDKSTSTSGVIHANAANQGEDFSVRGPLTRSKTRGRHPKVSRDKSASTSEVIHVNAINLEEDFIVNGPSIKTIVTPPTRGKTRGRPRNLNIDNNSIRPPKSTLGLVDEDEDDESEAISSHASNATGLGMSTVYHTRGRRPLQHSLAPPSMLSGSSIRGPPPFLRRNLRPRKHVE